VSRFQKSKYKRKESKKKVKINPMKKISDLLYCNPRFSLVGSKEVKQGGNNETKKGLYPY
jgi:hypothetical protein